MTNLTLSETPAAKLLTAHTHGEIHYTQKGDKPRLLILSGMHGDEAGVVTAVTNYIHTHGRNLPDFVAIPTVSPSALAAGTRVNKFGHDINRNFLALPFDDEASSVMSILTPYRTELCLDFHEDPDLSHQFYIYDSKEMTDEQLDALRKTVKQTGAGLYTGIDDSQDANLGLQIDHGYISTLHNRLSPLAGFASTWIERHHVAPRVVTIEVPGKAPQELKHALVTAMFSFFQTVLA